MGLSILEMVLQQLRQANFTADVAYPGQKFPQITEPVAAVHIEKVDRASLTVTLEVNIICPAAMGGTACEVEALRATETLRWFGGVCVQNACTYDGISQVYVVSVLADFTGITEEDSCTLGPGFAVYIDGVHQPYARVFTEEEIHSQDPVYVMGEPNPKGIRPGNCIWNLYLEELMPTGSPEMPEPAGDFELKVVTDAKTEVYYQCRWNSVRREFSREGLLRVRKGIAILREEE